MSPARTEALEPTLSEVAKVWAHKALRQMRHVFATERWSRSEKEAFVAVIAQALAAARAEGRREILTEMRTWAEDWKDCETLYRPDENVYKARLVEMWDSIIVRLSQRLDALKREAG